MAEKDVRNQSLSDNRNDTLLSSRKWYGLVNPFNAHEILSDCLGMPFSSADVIHIFDDSIYFFGGAPNTVMSCLGTRDTSFEIYPEDLFEIVSSFSPETFMAPISAYCNRWLGLAGDFSKEEWSRFPPPDGPKIGILTGNSPESGVTLAKEILQNMRSFFKSFPDTFLPKFQIVSNPGIGLLTDSNRQESLAESAIIEGLRDLLRGGCKLITLTEHVPLGLGSRIKTFCEQHDSKFISIVNATGPELYKILSHSDKISRIGILGMSRLNTTEENYSGHGIQLEAFGVTKTACNADDLAFSIKNSGLTHRAVSEFRRLIKDAFPNEDLIILAINEASLIYREHLLTAKKRKKYSGDLASRRIFIDSLLELGKYMMLLYLREGYRQNRVCKIPDDYDLEKRLFQRFGWIDYYDAIKPLF